MVLLTIVLCTLVIMNSWAKRAVCHWGCVSLGLCVMASLMWPKRPNHIVCNDIQLLRRKLPHFLKPCNPRIACQQALVWPIEGCCICYCYMQASVLIQKQRYKSLIILGKAWDMWPSVVSGKPCGYVWKTQNFYGVMQQMKGHGTRSDEIVSHVRLYTSGLHSIMLVLLPLSLLWHQESLFWTVNVMEVSTPLAI